MVVESTKPFRKSLTKVIRFMNPMNQLSEEEDFFPRLEATAGQTPIFIGVGLRITKTF